MEKMAKIGLFRLKTYCLGEIFNFGGLASNNMNYGELSEPMQFEGGGHRKNYPFFCLIWEILETLSNFRGSR